MADESPETGAREEPPAPLAEGRGVKGLFLKAIPWVVLTALGLFVGIQTAGVLLRDSLEGRRPLLAEAPRSPEAAGEAQPAREAPSRFGPEVREVAVAAPAPLPEAPRPSAGPAVATTPAPVPTPTPAPTPTAVPAPLSPPPPAQVQGKGRPTHVLEVDAFLSQRYLRETEQKLSSLGLPHLRVEAVHKGRGFRLAVASSDEAVKEKARRVLEAGNLAYRASKDGVEVYFYYEDEARAAADQLAAQGVTARPTPVEGERPVWKLFAGPFTEEEAIRARDRLAAQGLRGVLRKWP